MTAKEALYIIQVQLQKTPQNIEVIKVLQDIIEKEKKVEPLLDKIIINNDKELKKRFGTQAQHIINHRDKNKNEES